MIGYTKFAFFFFLVAKIIEINLQNKSFRDFFASYRVFLVKKTEKKQGSSQNILLLAQILYKMVIDNNIIVTQ